MPLHNAFTIIRIPHTHTGQCDQLSCDSVSLFLFLSMSLCVHHLFLHLYFVHQLKKVSHVPQKLDPVIIKILNILYLGPSHRKKRPVYTHCVHIYEGFCGIAVSLSTNLSNPDGAKKRSRRLAYIVSRQSKSTDTSMYSIKPGIITHMWKQCVYQALLPSLDGAWVKGLI